MKHIYYNLFDCQEKKNFKKMMKQLHNTIEHLNINNICYRFYSSGQNFQIIIDNGTFNNEQILDIVFNFKKRMGFNFIDLNGIGVFNKIRKCEYSLVKDIVVFPCIPQKVYDYNNYFNSNNLLKTKKFTRRGLKKINDQGKADNIIKLIQFTKKYMLI